MNYRSVLFLLLTLALMSFLAPQKFGKRTDKEVKEVFNIENYKAEGIKISEELQQRTPSNITTENFFRINSSSTLKGYVYFDKAPSKTAQFDYLIIFDSDLKIVKTKVLVYREEYGGEIGSRRWLSQFIGKSSDDSLNDIAAISGATISVRSMKNAVQDMLNSIKVLHAQKII